MASVMQTGVCRVLSIPLDNASNVPLHRQIYDAIRTRIVDGQLKPETLLPSTRALAADIHVARSTVVLAYEQLRAEGYLTSHLGGGTRVSRVSPEALTSTRVTSRRATPAVIAPRAVPSLPRAAVELRATMSIAPRAPRAFRAAVPAVDAFPVTLWAQSVTRVLRRAPGRQLAYGDPFGLPALREAIADYLTAARGVRCSPARIMVVNGSQHALTLCAAALVTPGDPVWLEDPFYVGTRGALELARAKIVPVGVDADGLCVAEGVCRAPNARAAFVTPSRQLPLGVTMSPARRLELLDWAARSGSWIIEDDYDSEFRFASRPVTALQGLDQADSVIYVGTFSKVMFPALRLAYMVIPESLMEVMLTVRHFSDFHTEYLKQAAMADFIRQGHFGRHIRRMRTMYAERAGVLVDALRDRLGGRIEVPAPTAGMTLVVKLRDGDDAAAIARAATTAGVELVPVSEFTMEHTVPPTLLFGYSAISPDDIRAGVATFAQVIAEYDARRAREG